MSKADKASRVGDGEGTEDRSIEIDCLDVRLPCRVYEIAYQLADAGRFSLTTEFLLRLLKAVDSLPETDLAEFFAFSGDEMAYVVSSAERYEYVARSGGKVRLTEKGESLFEIGNDSPALYDVKKKSGYFGFDLVSFCPVRGQMLSRFESNLPELPAQGAEAVSAASEKIRGSFKANFHEALSTAGVRNIEKTSLYSIDMILAQNRTTTLIPFAIRLKKDDWHSVEPDLIDWKPDSSLEHRYSILNACASIMKSKSTAFNLISADGADYLHECAPGIIEKYYRGNSFNAPVYLRRASALAGELRRDRPTARIYGTLWTRKNFKTIMDALSYGSTSGLDERKGVIWLRSAYPFWGCSARMPDIVDALRSEGTNTGEPYRAKAVLISQEGEEDSWRFKGLFDHIVRLEPGSVPRDFELLLVPGRFFAALAYLPVVAGEGWRVPLGVISFDKALLEGVQEMASDIVSHLTCAPGENFDLEALKQRMSEMLQSSLSPPETANVHPDNPPLG